MYFKTLENGVSLSTGVNLLEVENQHNCHTVAQIHKDELPTSFLHLEKHTRIKDLQERRRVPKHRQ